MAHEKPGSEPLRLLFVGVPQRPGVSRSGASNTGAVEAQHCRDTRRVDAALVENVVKDFTDSCQKGGSHERQMVRALANMIQSIKKR